MLTLKFLVILGSCIRWEIIFQKSEIRHIDPLFKDLKLLKIKDIYNFQLGCHMYHARARGEFATQIIYQTRGTNRAQTALHRITTTQHTISYTGPKLWNSLPPNLRSLNNYGRFKKTRNLSQSIFLINTNIW